MTTPDYLTLANEGDHTRRNSVVITWPGGRVRGHFRGDGFAASRALHDARKVASEHAGAVIRFERPVPGLVV